MNTVVAQALMKKLDRVTELLEKQLDVESESPKADPVKTKKTKPTPKG